MKPELPDKFKPVIEQLTKQQLNTLKELENSAGFKVLNEIVFEKVIERLKDSAFYEAPIGDNALIRHGARRGQHGLIEDIRNLVAEAKVALDKNK